MRTYQREFEFTGFLIEARELFEANNEELDFFNLNVDLNTSLYNNLDRMDVLRVFSVREDNVIIGYSLFIIQPHLQHKTHFQASQDVLYIKKDKRGYGISFIKFCDQALRDEGISFIFRSVPKLKDWSLILKRLEYKEIETIYMKDIRRE